MHPMLRIGIDAIQASKLSRVAPRLPFWQGPMRSQQLSRTVVDRLVDEIPLRVEGRSCDEHLFRTESDPERTSVKQQLGVAPASASIAHASRQCIKRDGSALWAGFPVAARLRPCRPSGATLKP
jgi:hypothetical protein